MFRPAARLIVINEKNEVLLVEMGKNWGIPGGGIDYGESISDALNRESVEELGVKAEFDRILFIQDYIGVVKGEERHCLEYFCLVKNNEDYFKVESQYINATHSHELKKVEFRKIDDFPENFMPKGLIPVLEKHIENKGNRECHYVTGS